ncbi:MAG: hypothetical protein JW751_03465 [Polyangiaceae bacterium]|nr:hypothetical protein [Polyangiaceae bacterium]
MALPGEAQALRIIGSLLSEWLGTSALALESSQKGPDLVAKGRGRTLLIGYERSADAAAIKSAIEQVTTSAARAGRQALPVVAVPFMGEVGQRLCAERGVHWLDLSGNASIRANGLVIVVGGRENRFKRRGRPSSVFSPKAARITRQLLIHTDRALLQKELAKLADLDAGYTSKIVRRLEVDGMVERDDAGRVRPKDFSLLLDAWSEDYAFDKHRIVRGQVAGRSSDQVVRRISSALKAAGAPHAATGLSGAWLLTRFATFRVTTFFVNEAGIELLGSEVGFVEEERGANTWLVVPNDEGVLHGASTKHGVRCAHPAQVYLDLLAHPERAREAAVELRKRLLPGSEAR